MQIGTIARLWRYPMKSLAAESLLHAQVEFDGIAGDRRAALLVASAGHARSGKPYRGKENNLLHTVRAPDAARELGAQAGVTLAPIAGERYFDAQPISLIFDSWLHDVEALVGRPLDPQRYRPNIFATATAGFTTREHDLVGAEIALGGALLQVVATIGRCVTTTYDVVSGESDPSVLREVARRRANTVGIYCTVERAGPIAVGDAIEQNVT